MKGDSKAGLIGTPTSSSTPLECEMYVRFGMVYNFERECRVNIYILPQQYCTSCTIMALYSLSRLPWNTLR